MKTYKLIITTLVSTGFMLGLVFSAEAESLADRDVVHDKYDKVITNTFGNCVRTRWMSNGDECRGYQQVAQVQNTNYRLADEDRTVYFDFNKTNLAQSEKNKLNTLTKTLKSMNDISGVSIVGYADRIGSSSNNSNLSERRAKVVEKYLHSQGYLDTTLAETNWMGESDSITQCEDNLGRKALIKCLSSDRRVTVEIKY